MQLEKLSFTNHAFDTTGEDFGCSYDKSIEDGEKTLKVQFIVPRLIQRNLLGQSGVSVGMINVSAIVATHAGVGGRKRRCHSDLHYGAWAQDGSVWKIPHCSFRPLHTAAKKMCLIGDSHFRRISTMRVEKEYGLVSTYKEGFKMKGHTYNDSSHVGKAPTVASAITKCHRMTNLQPNDIIVMGMGSHDPGAAHDDLITFIDDYAEHIKQIGVCGMVVATYDPCHEAIPAHFPANQRLMRNSWRTAYQTAVTRSAVEAARARTGARIYFVDTFAPSAALHWGHCDADPIKDPIHFGKGSFYREATKMVLTAAQTLCPR
jgi:hypothetical protein